MYASSHLQSAPAPSHPLKYLGVEEYHLKNERGKKMEDKFHPNPEATEKAWLKKNTTPFFISRIIPILEKKEAHSRRNQRYITTRSTSRTSGVPQRCLNEGTTFAVKPTTPWKNKISVLQSVVKNDGSCLSAGN